LVFVVLLAVHRRFRVQRIHLEGLLGLRRDGLRGGGFHLGGVVKWKTLREGTKKWCYWKEGSGAFIGYGEVRK